MKEQVKVLINSKKEAKQVKAILKGLGEPICDYAYAKDRHTSFYWNKHHNVWGMAVEFVVEYKEISIRDLILLLTKPEEEKVFVMTSEDGVKLYLGDSYERVQFGEKWYHAHYANGLDSEHCVVIEWEKNKAFSTKEAAEKWILEQNKPRSIEVKISASITATVEDDFVSFSGIPNSTMVLDIDHFNQITEAFKKINNQ